MKITENAKSTLQGMIEENGAEGVRFYSMGDG